MTVKALLSVRVPVVVAMLVLSACAAPPSRVPEMPPPVERPPEQQPGEPSFQFDPSAPEGRIEALRLAVSEPGFSPQLALSLLLDLPLAELQRQMVLEGRSPSLAPWLALAVAVRQHLLDDEALPGALTAWQQRYAPQSNLAPTLHEWVKRWRTGQPKPQHITVLLPGASSPLAAAGRVVRQGVLEAWLEQPLSQRSRLRFVDSGEGLAALVAAMEEIEAAESELVIGPLSRELVASVLDSPLRQPQQSWLLLNRPLDGIPLIEASSPMAVLALPPESEARAVAERMVSMGVTRALLAAEFSDFGRRVGAAFRDAFEQSGGELLEEVSFSPVSFDHTGILRQLLAIDESEQRLSRLETLLGEEVVGDVRPRTDFDALFVAARGERMRQLMPQLRFLDANHRPIFATSDAWPGGGVETDLEDLILPVSPWMLSDGPSARRRMQAEARFPALDGSPVLQVLHALGRDTLALADWIEEMKQDPALVLPGDLGRLSLKDGVEIWREPVWARVERGRLVRYPSD